MTFIQKVKLSFLLSLIVAISLASIADASNVEEVREFIKENYYEEVPSSVLTGQTIEEIMADLDRYSVYLTKKQMDELQTTLDPNFAGVGIQIEQHDQGVKVMNVFEEGPAEKAGLKAGDIITVADGSQLAGEPLEVSASILRGEVGTEVSVEWLRPSTSEWFKATIIREQIKVSTVKSTRLAGNIGYIRLSSFGLNSSADMRKAIQSKGDVDGWIFDVRNNGGGYVQTAQQVLGLFPAVEAAYVLQHGAEKVLQPPYRQSIAFEGPVQLLINEYSASASEIVAASLKDYQAATIYGQRSFGKGTMQQVPKLDNGDHLKLTVAEFYSPTGAVINNEGVQPDVETAIGAELIEAHRDLLLKQFKDYKNLGNLDKVETGKQFTIKLSDVVDLTSGDAVELIHIGGQSVEVELEAKSDRMIQVIPKQHLQAGGDYLLVVHPNWKSHSGVRLKQGSFVEVTVASE